MNKIAIAFAVLALVAPASSYAQDNTRQPAQAQQSTSDKALASKPVGGSGVAGQPTASGVKADSGVSGESENPGSRSK